MQLFLLSKQKLSISRVFVSVLLIILLAACGTDTVTTASPIQPHPSETVNKPEIIDTPLQAGAALSHNAAKLSVDAGNLRIQSEVGFQCPNEEPFGSVPMDQLVLASNRTTYSQDEIAQMRAYVEQNFSAYDELVGGKEPPPTLRWVLGASMDPIPGEEPASDYPCGAELDLTNTGNTLIQIPKVGVRLEKRPQENSYQYRLIDYCSLLPPSQECPPGMGSTGPCGVYSALIQLGLGEKNTFFSAVPGVPGCGPLTIDPGAQASLIFAFSVASNMPKNLVYSILPILTVDIAQKVQTLALQQLASTLAFASANQFSCYGLQGTTFVQVPSPVIQPNFCL